MNRDRRICEKCFRYQMEYRLGFRWAVWTSEGLKWMGQSYEEEEPVLFGSCQDDCPFFTEHVMIEWAS